MRRRTPTPRPRRRPRPTPEATIAPLPTRAPSAEPVARAGEEGQGHPAAAPPEARAIRDEPLPCRRLRPSADEGLVRRGLDPDDAEHPPLGPPEPVRDLPAPALSEGPPPLAARASSARSAWTSSGGRDCSTSDGHGPVRRRRRRQPLRRGQEGGEGAADDRTARGLRRLARRALVGDVRLHRPPPIPPSRATSRSPRSTSRTSGTRTSARSGARPARRTRSCRCRGSREDFLPYQRPRFSHPDRDGRFMLVMPELPRNTVAR